VIAADVAWLTQTLERWVQGGRRFAVGETIQLGWTLLKLHDGEGDTLELLELAPGPAPISWGISVTTALADLRLHKDVCESYFGDGFISFPFIADECVVCTNVEMTDEILMDRVKSAGSDSGWFIGCRDDGHDHQNPSSLVRISLHEAVRRCPGARMFVALPPETLVATGPAETALFHRAQRIAARPGSFVDQLLARRATG
jgi:hypothetical protein